MSPKKTTQVSAADNLQPDLFTSPFTNSTEQPDAEIASEEITPVPDKTGTPEEDPESREATDSIATGNTARQEYPEEPEDPELEADNCLLPDGSIDTEKQKKKFIHFCHRYIKRDRANLDRLLAWLAEKDFFEAPASTQYHGSYKGGLCQHSMDVLEYALKLNKSIFPADDKEETGKFSTESLCIASLFHDVCKVGLYGIEYRNKKNKLGVWESVPMYVINETFHFGGHGSKSVYLVQWFMKLTNEEAVAINCHMGFSDGSPSVTRDVSNAFHQYPMAWLIHVADEAATFLLDREPRK